MLRRLTVGAFILLIVSWFVVPPLAFYSPDVVTKWISLLTPRIQESYVYDLLLNKEIEDYKKSAVLEAWRKDLYEHDRKFLIADLKKLVPVTKMGGEALSEPIGLTAARIIIESKDCTAIGALFGYYRHDDLASSEIRRRMVEKNVVCLY